MRDIWFWALIPLLLPQALYVRKTAPRFAPAIGPSNGFCGSGKQARLIAIGDSIIAGVGATTLSKALVGQTASALAVSLGSCIEWTALGISGYNSEKVLNRLVPELPDIPADYVILSVGVNDVTGLTTLRQWRQNLNLLVAGLQTHSPNAVVAVAGLPPLHSFPLLPQPLRAVFGMRSRSLDEELRKVLHDLPNCVYVPLDFDPDPSKFAPDGYHPSEEGYAEYGRHMADELFKAATRRNL